VLDQADVGSAIERKLEQLRASIDRHAYEQAMDLLQLVSELYGTGLARIMELVAAHAPALTEQLVADDLVSSLLIANGLHPADMAARVAAALDHVRPILAAHGGDVELIDLDERLGAVRLRLIGSCDGCPSSAATLRMTVEQAIRESAPEIGIIDVEQPSEQAVATPALSIPIALGTKPG
jgi:Fe-S cluster biogenesis protein NfuA